jgi:ribonuclease D
MMLQDLTVEANRGVTNLIGAPEGPISSVPDVEYKMIETQEQLVEMVKEITCDPEVSTDRILAIDTETTGLDPYTSQLLLLQISSIKQIYVIDCRNLDLAPIKEIFEDPSWLLIAHNCKFDYKMLKVQGKVDMANMFDTMLAERLLTAG